MRSKEQRNLATRLYRQKNREVLRIKAAKYREKNKERIAKSQKDWYENHKDYAKQKAKEYYENNKEARKKTQKEYYKNNKEACDKRNRKNRKITQKQLKNNEIKRLRKEIEMLKIKCRAVKRKFKCDNCGEKEGHKHSKYIDGKTECWFYVCGECLDNEEYLGGGNGDDCEYYDKEELVEVGGTEDMEWDALMERNERIRVMEREKVPMNADEIRGNP